MQAITSAKTSRRGVAAVVRLVDKAFGWEPATFNIDLGGGQWNDTTNALGGRGVASMVVDPYNRADSHNRGVRRYLGQQGLAHTCTLSNVLNVIREPNERIATLTRARQLVRPGGRIYITVYEGDRRSRGRRTRDGWQANRPLKNYLREVRKVWPGAQRKGGLMWAVKS